MSGLLQRAAEIRANKRNLRLVKAGETDEFEELGGTPEERLEIIEQIDQVISSHQGTIKPDTFEVQARKRGILLPILVNLIAIILLAGGAYAINRTLQAQESTVVGQATALSSTEGRLLAQLREESDAQIEAKNNQISGIQNQLATISAEREALAANINDQLESREETLRSEFEAELEAERSRLASGGLSESEIAERLEEFQAGQEAEFENELEAIRSAAAAELEARESELTARISQAQEDLAAAESERVALAEELREQESRLNEDFAAREAELTAERAAAVTLLTELQDQQEQERIALDQIIAFYDGIQTDLTAGNLDLALQGTAALREFLSEGPSAELPAVQRRRRVELFLVESLEDRIESEQALLEPDSQSLVESARVVARVTELVATAEDAYGAADFEGARTLYLAALSEIPAVDLGFQRLAQIEERANDAESERVAALIQLANNLYLAGSYEQAASAYGDVLATIPSADSELLSRVLDAGYQLRTQSDLTSLRQAQADLEQARAELVSARAQADQARADADQARANAERLREEASQASARADLADELLAGERALADQASADLEVALASLEQARIDLDQARTDAESARAQAEQARTALAAVQSDEAATATQEEEAALRVARADAELARAQAQEAETRAAEANAQAEAALAGLAAANAEAEASQADATAARTQATEARAEADAARAEAEAALAQAAAARAEADAARVEAVAARSDAEAAESDAEEARADASAARDAAESLETEAATERERATEALAAIAAIRAEAQGVRAELDRRTALVSDQQDTIAEQEARLADLQASLAQALGSEPEDTQRVQSLEAELSTLRATSAPLRTAYEEQQELANEIVRYKQRFTQTASAPDSGVSSLQLLETKLLILRIIGTDAVRSQYPGLASELNKYLDALVAEERADATEQTIAAVNQVLELLLDESESVQATADGRIPSGLESGGTQTTRMFDLLRDIADPE